MDDLSLQDMVDIFLDHIGLIIIITLLVTALGLGYTKFLKKPMYEADSTLLLTTAVSVNDNSTVATSITQSDVTLNQKLVATYGEIIKSRKILNQVIEMLKLDITPEKLQNYITVSSKSDTELIDINVHYNDPAIAADITNSISDIFSKEIVNIYNIKNISIIDRAKVNYTPYNISILKQTVIFFVLGLAISLFIVCLINYLDASVKDVDEVEKKLNVPVLAVVPICQGKEVIRYGK